MNCGVFISTPFIGFNTPWQGRNYGSKVEGDHHGERGSASLYGGLGALPPVGSRGKAPGEGVRGQSLPEAEAYITIAGVNFCLKITAEQ
jgi:hypothetical protein